MDAFGRLATAAARVGLIAHVDEATTDGQTVATEYWFRTTEGDRLVYLGESLSGAQEFLRCYSEGAMR